LPNSAKSKRHALHHIKAVGRPGPIHNYQRPDMTSRDHLVMLLISGAEIEHALMVQYLYAAYSINGDQDTKEHRAMVEGWRASILSVAREEMGHLLTVQNVLVLLGAPINLSRAMIPWDHEFYPFPFSLEPLSKETLQCFIYAEMPRLEILGTAAPGKQREKIAPSSIPIEKQQDIIKEITDGLAKRFKRVTEDTHRVGELYDEIIDLIKDPKRIPDSAFNEATYDMQACWDDWGRGYKAAPRALDPEGSVDPNDDPGGGELTPYAPGTLASRDAHVQIERAATRAQAIKALKALAAQGEAPHLREDETGEPSHFERFIHIYEELKDLQTRDPSFKPMHGVPRNPTTRSDFAKLKPELRPSDFTYISTHDNELAAHNFAQLFNQRYRLLLMYLAHSFRLARTQPMHQPSLRAMVMHRAFGEMYNLKTIAGLLVRLPRHGGGRAGPPFEMPYSLDLPQADRDIWRQYDDLLSSSLHTCSEVFRVAKLIPAVKEQIERTGGDVYLHTLINLDKQAQLWIGKILAGAP
jgi:Ferritin-like